MAILLDPILNKVKEALALHRLSDGAYKRMYSGNTANPYGCADAVNLMYTLNERISGVDRQTLIDSIKQFQDPETGLFSEETHHPYHCTAHCMAALNLLGEVPEFSVRAMERYADPMAVAPWLKTVDSAHIGAGVFSVFFLEGNMTPSWQNAFFAYLDAESDPKYGISRRGDIDSGRKPGWLFMGDWFHYLFCYYACRRPFPNADRLVDSCIDLYINKQFPDSFGKGQRFLDIDWAFSLNRAAIQSVYRLEDSRSILKEFAYTYTWYLEQSSMDEIQWDDLHLLFGAVCGLAELQIALPGELISTRPLRQVLESRPFI